MNKWVVGFMVLISGAIGGPLLKMLYDVYTNTTAGVLILTGVDNNTLTILRAIPWLAPALCFIITLIIWSRPDDPTKKNRQYGPWQ